MVTTKAMLVTDNRECISKNACAVARRSRPPRSRHARSALALAAAQTGGPHREGKQRRTEEAHAPSLKDGTECDKNKSRRMAV